MVVSEDKSLNNSNQTFLSPDAVEEMRTRAVREFGVDVDLKAPGKADVTTIRITATSPRPELPYEVAHALIITSYTGPATNLARQNVAEPLRPEFLQDGVRQDLLEKVVPQGPLGMKAIADFCRRYWHEGVTLPDGRVIRSYKERYAEQHGVEPREFDARGVPYWFPTWMMIDVIPAAEFQDPKSGDALEDVRIVDIEPGDPRNGTLPIFTLEDTKGNRMVGTVRSHTAWLLEWNVGIGQVPEYNRREQHWEYQRARAEAAQAGDPEGWFDRVRWDAAGYADRKMLSTWLTASRECRAAKGYGDEWPDPPTGPVPVPTRPRPPSPPAKPIRVDPLAASLRSAQARLGAVPVTENTFSSWLVNYIFQSRRDLLAARRAALQNPETYTQTAHEIVEEALVLLADAELPSAVMELAQEQHLELTADRVAELLQSPAPDLQAYRERIAAQVLELFLADPQTQMPVVVVPASLTPEQVRRNLNQPNTLAVVVGREVRMNHAVEPFAVSAGGQPVDVVGLHTDWLTQDGRVSRLQIYNTAERVVWEVQLTEPMTLPRSDHATAIPRAYVVDLPEEGEVAAHREITARLRAGGIAPINPSGTAQERADDKLFLLSQRDPKRAHSHMFSKGTPPATVQSEVGALIDRNPGVRLVVQPRKETTGARGVTVVPPGSSQQEQAAAAVTALQEAGHDAIVQRFEGNLTFDGRELVLRSHVSGDEIQSGYVLAAPYGETVVSTNRGAVAHPLADVVGHLVGPHGPVSISPERMAELDREAVEAVRALNRGVPSAERLGLVALDRRLLVDEEGQVHQVILEANARGGGFIAADPQAVAASFWHAMGLRQAPSLAQWRQALQEEAQAAALLGPHYAADQAAAKREQLLGFLGKLSELKTPAGEAPFAEEIGAEMPRTPGRALLMGRHLDYPGNNGGSIGSPTRAEINMVVQVVDGMKGEVDVYAVDPPGSVAQDYPQEGKGPRRFRLGDKSVTPDRPIRTLEEWDAWAEPVTLERRKARDAEHPEKAKLNYADDLAAAAVAFLRTEFGDPSGRVRAFLDELQRQGKGLRIAVTGDLPPGGGLSSSSATLLGVVQALDKLCGAGLGIEGMIRAGYAERTYTGVKAGTKDHSHIMTPAAFRGVVPSRPIAEMTVPEGVAVLLVDSKIDRDSAPKYSAKMSQEGNDEQNIKWRTGIGYALGVLWIRQYHPEWEDRLLPGQYKESPLGLLRELLPGSPNGLTLKEFYDLLREIPAGGLTRAQLYEALPRFQKELDFLFGKSAAQPAGTPEPPAPYPVREMLLFGLAEEARNWEVVRVLRHGEQGGAAAEVSSGLLSVVGVAHDGDRVKRYLISGQLTDDTLQIEEQDYDWRLTDERLDALIADPDSEEAVLWKQPGWLERSIEPLDFLVDLIRFYDQQNGGGVAAAMVSGAGLGGTVTTVLVRPDHQQPLQDFLLKHYYNGFLKLNLTEAPVQVARPGKAASILSLPHRPFSAGQDEKAQALADYFKDQAEGEIPLWMYGRTPIEELIPILRAVPLGPEDEIWDLGAGDGRVGITAVVLGMAKKAVLVEMDPDAVQAIRRAAAHFGLNDSQVEIIETNVFAEDFQIRPSATCIYHSVGGVYDPDGTRGQIAPMAVFGQVVRKIRDGVAPGTRVVFNRAAGGVTDATYGLAVSAASLTPLPASQDAQMLEMQAEFFEVPAAGGEEGILKALFGQMPQPAAGQDLPQWLADVVRQPVGPGLAAPALAAAQAIAGEVEGGGKYSYAQREEMWSRMARDLPGEIGDPFRAAWAAEVLGHLGRMVDSPPGGTHVRQALQLARAVTSPAGGQADMVREEVIDDILAHGITVEKYRGLNPAEREHLRKRTTEELNAPASELGKFVSRPPNPLTQDDRLSELLDLVRELDRRYPKERFVCLGTTPLLLGEMAHVLPGFSRRMEYVALSNGWYERASGKKGTPTGFRPRSHPGPNPEQILAYRTYLAQRGMDPQTIVREAQAGRKTVLLDYIDEGGTMESFRQILSHWASEHGLQDSLWKSIVVVALKFPGSPELPSFLGLGSPQTLEVGERPHRLLVPSIHQYYQLGVPYPYSQWRMDNFPPHLGEGGPTQATLTRFLLMDFLARNGAPAGPAAGQEEVGEHVERMSEILDEQRWGDVGQAARDLALLLAGSTVPGWVAQNAEGLRRLDALVQRVQALGPEERPSEPDGVGDRLLRRWEANAVALLSAVSFGGQHFLSEEAATHLLEDPQSLEGHLLFRLGRYWDESAAEHGQADQAGLTGLGQRYPDLPLDLMPAGQPVEQESAFWINAWEVVNWSTPPGQYEQTAEEVHDNQVLATSMRIAQAILMAAPPPGDADLQAVLQTMLQSVQPAFEILRAQMGRVPPEVRRGLLMRSDAATLNLAAVFYHTAACVAALTYRMEAARALMERAERLYQNIHQHVDSAYPVWRPPGLPGVEIPLPLPDLFTACLEAVNRALAGRDWVGLGNAASEMSYIMVRTLELDGPETVSAQLGRLDEMVRDLQTVLQEGGGPQDQQALEAVQIWQVAAVVLLVSTGRLSELTADLILQDPLVTGGHLWTYLFGIWQQLLINDRTQHVAVSPRQGEPGDLFRNALEAFPVLAITSPPQGGQGSGALVQATRNNLLQRWRTLLVVGEGRLFVADPASLDPQQIEENLNVVLEQMGPIPDRLRREILLRRDAAIVNVGAAVSEVASRVAARMGLTEPAGVHRRIAEATYGAAQELDPGHEVWRPFGLGSHVRWMNGLLDSGDWSQSGMDLIQSDVGVGGVRALTGGVAPEAGHLRDLEQTLQRVQALARDQRPQDPGMDLQLRAWEAIAVAILSAASAFGEGSFLSEQTAYAFLDNPNSLEGHLWVVLRGLWDMPLRQGGTPAAMGLTGIMDRHPGFPYPPEMAEHQWNFWLDGVCVLIYTAPEAGFDPAQDPRSVRRTEPAALAPSLIAQHDHERRGEPPAQEPTLRAFERVVEEAGQPPFSVRLAFLRHEDVARNDAAAINLSSVFYEVHGRVAEAVGRERVAEMLVQQAVHRYNAINSVDPDYEVWRPFAKPGELSQRLAEALRGHPASFTKGGQRFICGPHDPLGLALGAALSHVVGPDGQPIPVVLIVRSAEERELARQLAAPGTLIITVGHEGDQDPYSYHGEMQVALDAARDQLQGTTMGPVHELGTTEPVPAGVQQRLEAEYGIVIRPESMAVWNDFIDRAHLAFWA